MGEPETTRTAANCTGPFSDARDCPVHRPQPTDADLIAQLRADLASVRQAQQKMVDAGEMLWVVVANVSGGDWTKQTPEWQEAAARWRDNYFAAFPAAPSADQEPTR